MTSTISLRHFMKILFEHMKLVLLVLALVNGGVLLFNILAPRVYESSAKVYVESVAEELALMQKARPFMDPPSAEQLLSTESEIITSYNVLTEAWKQVYHSAPSALEIEALKQSIQIIPVKKANVIDITLQSENSQHAALLLNEMLRVYSSYRGSIKAADSSAAYIDRQLAAIKSKMDSLYQAQDVLVTEHGLADYENSMRLTSTSIYELEAAIRGKKERQSELNGLAAMMESDLKAFEADPNAALTVSDNWAIVRGLVTQLEEAKTALRIVEQQYTAESAEGRKAAAKVNTLQQQLRGAFRAQLNDVKRQQREVGKEIEVAQQDMAAKRQTLLSIPEVQSRFVSAQSAIENLNSLYGDLSKARAAKGSQENATENISISVISPALVPINATYPRVWQNTLLGLFASLVIALSLVYLMEGMDTSIKFSDDLEKLGIRYLVGVPSRK